MGTTYDKFQTSIADDIKISDYVEKKVAADIQIEETAAKEVFEKNPAPYSQKEQVRARHILIKVDPKASEEVLNKAKTKATEIVQMAKKEGADFAQLAKDKSEGPSSVKGGDLGAFPKGAMVPEFEKVAFELKAGEISDLVKTQFGFHIIKVEEKMAAKEAKFEDAKAVIMSQLKNAQIQQMLESELTKLRSAANIELLM